MASGEGCQRRSGQFITRVTYNAAGKRTATGTLLQLGGYRPLGGRIAKLPCAVW